MKRPKVLADVLHAPWTQGKLPVFSGFAAFWLQVLDGKEKLDQ